MRPGAFNDPDRVQPPATVPGSTATPGLTYNEAQAQFVRWAARKAPLMLGAHFATLATLRTDHADYFNLVTNPEVIGINQDLSPQATLVQQAPSAAQQAAGAEPRQLTWQQCDSARADQTWDAGDDGAIRATGTSLCVTDGVAAVDARRCVTGAPSQAWRLRRDSQFSAAVANASRRCLVDGGTAPTSAACAWDGSIPPPLDAQLAQQAVARAAEADRAALVDGGGHQVEQPADGAVEHAGGGDAAGGLDDERHREALVQHAQLACAPRRP